MTKNEYVWELITQRGAARTCHRADRKMSHVRAYTSPVVVPAGSGARPV